MPKLFSYKELITLPEHELRLGLQIHNDEINEIQKNFIIETRNIDRQKIDLIVKSIKMYEKKVVFWMRFFDKLILVLTLIGLLVLILLAS